MFVPWHKNMGREESAKSVCVCVCVFARGKRISGWISGWGGHKNLCGGREASGYVSLSRVVKRQRFHTLKHVIQ